MRLRCGILIIGSLFWDGDGGRDRWRQWRLEESDVLRVPVPIRYGRKSRTRGNTYTMVFARLGSESSGQGVVLPCRQPIGTPNDLIAEAHWLWAAETKAGVPGNPDEDPPHGLFSTWGRVAIVRRPEAKISEGILASWRDRFAGCGDDTLLVNDDGILEIDWPTDPHLQRFDMSLTTTNRPTDLEPSARSIAEAWNDHPEYRVYFEQNQQAQIYTFQDSAIKRHLR